MDAEYDSETDVWKQKYYDLAERMERQDTEWAAIERLLRQGISRLTLLTDSRDPALSRAVDGIRQAIRRGDDSQALSPLLEDLSEIILHCEEGKPSEKPSRGGLLGRWLPGKSVDSAPQPEPMELALGVLTRLAEQLFGDVSEQARSFRESAESAQHAGELKRLADNLAALIDSSSQPDSLPIHEVLLRLIERLEIPQALESRAEAIKASLVPELPPAEVERNLAAIADLITEMRSQVQDEKRDLESFLQQLTAGLQELDRAFQSNAAVQRESFEGGQHLDAAVSDQVTGIAHSVRDATDLHALQATVRQHLDTINSHMYRFREAEARRARDAEAQVEQLTERLRSVEGEVAQLHERIYEERRQATVDPLTGIPNRLAYNERITQEYARWRRYGNPLCLAVWDVDRFKRINDVYGHQAGDQVLRVIAKLLAGNTRASNLVVRYGGEEFATLLPETVLSDAARVADKLRETIARCDFHHGGKPVSVTISCGVAQFRPGDDPDTVFRRADSALYRAKADGRNRCLSEEDLS